MTDDLNILAPTARIVRVGERDIEIKPIKIGLIPSIAKNLQGINLAGDIDVMELMAERGADLIEAVAIAAGLSISEAAVMDMDEFAALLSAVIEVNADFFSQKVLPTIVRAANKVNRVG